MFRRRVKLNLGDRLRSAVWPRSGWRRSALYIYKRLIRLPGTSYSLAAGFACGAAISFTPFVGLHFFISAFVAWIIRADVVSALIGTAVGNPWTFPLIWVWIYQLGVWMGVGDAAVDAHEFEFSVFFGDLFDATLRLDIVFLFDTAWPVIGPMLAGSVPTGLVVWMVFYFPMRRAIEVYHRRRSRRRASDGTKHV